MKSPHYFYINVKTRGEVTNWALEMAPPCSAETGLDAEPCNWRQSPWRRRSPRMEATGDASAVYRVAEVGRRLPTVGN